jgi:hypothetical protein
MTTKAVTAQKVVTAQLDYLLEPRGFVRKKETWNRRVDSLVDVVDIQISKAGDAVTVNSGVLDTDVHTTFWGSEPPEFIEQPYCTVCARIGELIDGRDKWWPLGNNGTATEMAEKVTAHVLLFLERMHSREAMRQWLIDNEVAKKKYLPPIINLAILKSLQGDVAQGCELLAELQKKSLGAWQKRAAEVAARLHCERSSGAQA